MDSIRQRFTALTALVGVLLLAASGLNGLQSSSAAFTSTSMNARGAASAAIDWTPPTVSVVAPTAPLKGVVTVSAAAADGETGVKSVTIQALIGGAWSTLCTTTAAPYRCSWDTNAVADGAYDLRATAVDVAGYSAESALVRATVSNSFGITLTDPGEVLRGTITLNSTLQNANILALYNVRFEYSVAEANKWTTIPGCLSLLGSASCTKSWATSGIPSGTYDLRAVATPVLNPSNVAYSAVITDVIIDNTAPTVSMIDPGTPLRGTTTLAANATDSDFGVASVAIQFAPNGSSSWTTACTITQSPFSCRFATTGLPTGRYSFRAIATDVAGNVTTSGTVTNRTIDNTVSSVSLEDPGAFLSGTQTLTANANSTAGVTSVTFQWAPSGSGTWTTICVATVAPYSCAWDTAAVADGEYSLRAVLVDGTGAQTIATAIDGRAVDNTPVRGLDVQTANRGGTAGRVDAGDTITFTYSKPMAPASILSGWNGTATGVVLRLRDGNLLGTGNTGDTLDVLVGGAPIALGSVNLRGDYIKSKKVSTSNATMTAITTTVNGQTVTTVTITVGSLISGGALRTVTAGGTMHWSPSATATDLSGVRCSTAPVSETGALDREF